MAEAEKALKLNWAARVLGAALVAVFVWLGRDVWDRAMRAEALGMTNSLQVQNMQSQLDRMELKLDKALERK